MKDKCANEIVYSKKVPLKKTYDVVVCGGGVAGVAAAVSAAKNGCSTLLLEKSNILGGLGTLGLVNLFVPMCNGRGKQIIFGLAENGYARARSSAGILFLMNGETVNPKRKLT